MASMSARVLCALVAVALCLLLGLVGCSKTRYNYQQGMHHLQAQEYSEGLEKFELVLAADPESSMALFGKARCIYELTRYDEALPLFEQFLTQTEGVRASYRDERFDAEFYRDKCKQELGIEVPQDPDAIPEERMRY